MSMRMEQFGAPEFVVRADPMTDDEMRLINKWALKPLSRNDVAIFSMELCNNMVDKHFSRFPEDELTKINRMVVGKPLMENHDIGRRLPRGTFFNSQMRASGNKVTVTPDMFIPRIRTNEDFIKNIEAGVYRQTSIGFMFDKPECSICHEDYRQCPHNAGEKYSGAATCHYIMHNVTDVLEGSIVPAGSQGTVIFGARGLPICSHQTQLKGVETICSGCGTCSCGKAEDIAVKKLDEAFKKKLCDDFMTIFLKPYLDEQSADIDLARSVDHSGSLAETAAGKEDAENVEERIPPTPEEQIDEVLHWVDEERKKLSPYAP